MASTIMFSALKGGSGKTTFSIIAGKLLSEQKIRTLVIDLDPQADATYTLEKTFGVQSNKDLMTGIRNENLKSEIVVLDDYLHMIPTTWNIGVLSEYLRGFDATRGRTLINDLLEPLKKDYDFIILDTVPSASELFLATLSASDYVIGLMAVSTYGKKSVLKLSELIANKRFEHKLKAKFIKVVPYALEKYSASAYDTLVSAKEDFGDSLTNHGIRPSERVRKWANGITNTPSIWDKKAREMYNNVLVEILDTIEAFEKAGQGV